MTLAAAILLLQATLAAPPHAGVPFAVGERLEYQGRHTIFRPGTAVLNVDAIESWYGQPHWKFSFTSSVSFLGFKSRTELVSWTGVDDFISRRFTKTMEENGRRTFEDFRIHPDSGFVRRGDDTAIQRTPARPLDDVAFFYWIRTIPLQMGETYRFANYYRDERNPVTVRVIKRETMEMPDGTKVPCLVLHPIVDEPNGMFSARSDARLWLTDDARRIPVQIQSTYNFGTVKLVLQKVTPGNATDRQAVRQTSPSSPDLFAGQFNEVDHEPRDGARCLPRHPLSISSPVAGAEAEEIGVVLKQLGYSQTLVAVLVDPLGRVRLALPWSVTDSLQVGRLLQLLEPTAS